MNVIAKKINTIGFLLGRYIPWLMFPMALTTFVVVVMRYVFNYGRVDIQEIIIYLHAIIIMLCMSYTMKSDQHVRVDIFYQRFSDKNVALVNLIGNILFLIPVCITIIITSWDYTIISWRIMEKSSESDGLPLLFIIKSLTPIMAILLLIQSITANWFHWKTLTKQWRNSQ